MLAVSSCVLVVSDVLVSPWLMGVLGEDFLSGFDREFVEWQSSSLSRKRHAVLVGSQGAMSMASSPEEVSPITRRRIQEVDCGVGRG